MKRWMKIVGLVSVATLALGVGVVRHLEGPSGESAMYGGSIEATAVPDFTSSAPSSWVNGAPATLASLQGSPVLLEIWSPT
jgi:hypothetical protein